MKTFTSRTARQNFGALLETARRSPVLITRRGRRSAYVLSPHLYDQISRLCEHARQTEIAGIVSDIAMGDLTRQEYFASELLARLRKAAK